MLFGVGFFLFFFAIFAYIGATERLITWFAGHDIHSTDEALLAGLLTLMFLLAASVWAMVENRATVERSRELLQTALDSVADGVALFDQNERLVMWNEGFVRTSPGLRAIVEPGLTFPDLVARMAAAGRYLGVGPDWVEKRVRQFRALESVEDHMRDPDGGERWAEVRLYRTRDGGTFLVRTDVTQRRRAEAELATVRQRLADAFEGIGDGLAMFDRNEQLVMFNRRYAGEFPMLAGILKPGLSFEAFIRALAAHGYYGRIGEGWIEERVLLFRALQEAEYSVPTADGVLGWRVVRQFRTAEGGTLNVLSDITERKRAEAELASSRHQLQTAIDSIAAGVALYDKDERLVLFNEGYTRDLSVIGDILRPGLLLSEEVATLVKRGNYVDVGGDWVEQRIRAFRALATVESRQHGPAGDERWISSSHYRTRDGGTFLVREDITERKQAEAALAASRNLLQSALESVTDGVALFDKDERLVVMNENYLRGHKLPPGKIAVGVTYRDIIQSLVDHGAYIDPDPGIVERRLRAFRALEPAELHVFDQSGVPSWIIIRLYRTRDGGTFLVREDITARKQAEEKLRYTQGLLLTAIESMSDGVALFDKDERLVLWNEEYPRNPAMIREVVKAGIAFTDLCEDLMKRGGYAGNDRTWLVERIRKFRALQPIELTFRDADGTECWFNMTHHRTRDGGTLVVRKDVTERVRAMGEIERARLVAESANESKTKFLASMSHELRTPLNAILGFAQLVEIGVGKMAEAQTREYLGIVLKSGQHLLDLVSQILEFARLESQGEGGNSSALVPADLVRQCLDMVRESADRGDVTIVDRTGAAGADIRFLGDPLWSRQVLLNFLTNAVKYNRTGGTVTLTRVRRPNGMVRFAVADTGLGIPTEARDQVFQPFQRLGREAGQIEGAGLGLALSRQLVLRKGGEIGFDSRPGEGSTFWFDLPAVAHEDEKVA
jgi:signal transduction histidine kinase